MTWLTAHFLTNFAFTVGFYRTLKRLKSAKPDFELLVYWTVLAALELYSSYIEWLFSWFPFYFYAKSALLVLMLIPKLRVARLLFHTSVIPFMHFCHAHLAKHDPLTLVLYELPLATIDLLFPGVLNRSFWQPGEDEDGSCSGHIGSGGDDDAKGHAGGCSSLGKAGDGSVDGCGADGLAEPPILRRGSMREQARRVATHQALQRLNRNHHLTDGLRDLIDDEGVVTGAGAGLRGGDSGGGEVKGMGDKEVAEEVSDGLRRGSPFTSTSPSSSRASTRSSSQSRSPARAVSESRASPARPSAPPSSPSLPYSSSPSRSPVRDDASDPEDSNVSPSSRSPMNASVDAEVPTPQTRYGVGRSSPRSPSSQTYASRSPSSRKSLLYSVRKVLTGDENVSIRDHLFDLSMPAPPLGSTTPRSSSTSTTSSTTTLSPLHSSKRSSSSSRGVGSARVTTAAFERGGSDGPIPPAFRGAHDEAHPSAIHSSEAGSDTGARGVTGIGQGATRPAYRSRYLRERAALSSSSTSPTSPPSPNGLGSRGTSTTSRAHSTTLLRRRARAAGSGSAGAGGGAGTRTSSESVFAPGRGTSLKRLVAEAQGKTMAEPALTRSTSAAALRQRAASRQPGTDGSARGARRGHRGDADIGPMAAGEKAATSGVAEAKSRAANLRAERRAAKGGAAVSARTRESKAGRHHGAEARADSKDDEMRAKMDALMSSSRPQSASPTSRMNVTTRSAARRRPKAL